MSPKAEIYFPDGVNQEKIQDATDNLGGRFVAFKEHKQIEISGISSSEIGSFLSYQGFNSPENSTYATIFSDLRQLPQKEQEDLLINFYKERIKGFPNPEKFAEELVRINNIDYFKPKKEPDPKILQALINQHLNRLNLPEAKIKIIRMRLYGEYKPQTIGNGVLWNIAAAAPWRDARDATWFVRDTVETVSWSSLEAARNAIQDAEKVTAWIILEDIMSEKGYIKGNPFTPLMEIYEQGYWPVGLITNKEGQTEFNILVPPL
jgi:hypothetical protein